MENTLIVAKFGGTSMQQMERVAAICTAYEDRAVIVVSSPKITDILIHAWRLYVTGANEPEIALQCSDADHRFAKACGRAPTPGFRQELLRAAAFTSPSKAYFVSRGEFFAAQALAEQIGGVFVDASDLIRFDDSGVDIEATYGRCRMLSHRIESGQRIVVPGFYGAVPSGHLRLLDRGGSDITGALIAAALGASVYENWTDVDGIRFTDPRDYADAKRINTITYDEMRELAYAGARVLHEHAIFPCRRAGIPTHLRNTFNPEAPGTMITPSRVQGPLNGSVVGIAGRKSFPTIKVSAEFMHENIGYVCDVLGILRQERINLEHMPSGIDCVTFVVSADAASVHRAAERIRTEMRPNSVECRSDTAIISIVGSGMRHIPGTLAKVTTALAEGGINVRLITQSTSEISIVVGVADEDYLRAVRALSAQLS